MTEQIVPQAQVKIKWSTPEEDVAIARYMAKGRTLRDAVRTAVIGKRVPAMDAKMVQRINRIIAQYEAVK